MQCHTWNPSQPKEVKTKLPGIQPARQKKNVIKGFREKWAWKERKWSEISDDTGTGNPQKSNPEKGKKFFDDVTDKISELMQDICKNPMNQWYQ